MTLSLEGRGDGHDKMTDPSVKHKVAESGGKNEFMDHNGVSAAVPPRARWRRRYRVVSILGAVSVVVAGLQLGATIVHRWELRACLRGHDLDIMAASFSPDGKLLATASADHTARVWAWPTGEKRAILRGHTDTVISVAFAPDSKSLATASHDGTVKIWDAVAGKIHFALPGHGPRYDGTIPRAYSVAFSSDGQTLASGGSDRSVRLWDVATGRQRAVLEEHSDSVVSLAIAARLLAARSKDGDVKLWDMVTSKALRTIEGDKFASPRAQVALSPDGKTLATNTEKGGSVKLWDVNTGRLRLTLMGGNRWVWGMAFSPDGKILAACTMGKTLGGSLRLWDVGSGQLLRTKWFVNEYTVAFSPDGKTIATTRVGSEQDLCLWDVDKLLGQKTP